MIAIAADEFARVANERLGAEATVVVYGGGQLGDDQEVLQKLKLGTVEFALPSTVMSSVVPEIALFDMPYLIADREHMRRVEENGFRHVTNDVRPIRRPADLDGLKIRTPNSPWRISLFRALGANPSPMPFSEVFLALQTGVMDGQENPLTNIHNASFDDVQTYLSLTRHVYSPAYLTVSAEHWSRLPATVRDVLEDVARQTQSFVHETARRVDAEMLGQLRQGGMEVNEVDREMFVRASRPVYDEFDARVPGGGEWIVAALALARGAER
jgi:TRAP-type C4-dicarboxylate transport system substrate-binding protein